MAERTKIQPWITNDLVKLLDQEVAKIKGSSRSQVIETALRAYLLPASEGNKLDQILEQIGRIIDILEPLSMLARDPAPEPKAQELKPKVATYEEMYGPITHTPRAEPEQPPVIRPSRRRWRWSS